MLFAMMFDFKGPVCDIYKDLLAQSEVENTHVCF